MSAYYFYGDSHAAKHLRDAAAEKFLAIADDPADADLLFISQDTPTDEQGRRNMGEIVVLLSYAAFHKKPIVLTSQCEPGFTRAQAQCDIELYHQAETLRIKDAWDRALAPDYIAVGCKDPAAPVPSAYMDYLERFDCPVIKVSYETAEFSKIAVNMTLAAQVDNTNRLAAAAEKCGAHWPYVANILGHDKRIGRESYLTPGRWQDSPHLMRDYVTLTELLK